MGIPVIFGYVYYAILWVGLLWFCGQDMYILSGMVLTGKWGLLLEASLYALKLVLCSTLITTAFCSILAKWWRGENIERFFQRVCRLGAFALGVCTILSLLYTAFPNGFADELQIEAAAANLSPEDHFNRAYFVMSWAVVMANCSAVIMKEVKKAYNEYKSHEIRVSVGESNLQKFIKRFQKTK